MHTIAAAASHVGKVRSNNQDSAYAGRHLFMVADGMGGHAGGDVASAITVRHVRDIDRLFDDIGQAAEALQTSLVGANAALAETVYQHAELAGMGTTVSALLRVDDQFSLAHIGDSRIYLLRNGELRQLTSDHTFVQRLVDSGRITPEEALVHPRRSVLMRVLGDVESPPDLDSELVDIKPGDRWMLCSDGLSSYVDDDRSREILSESLAPASAVERLINESLANGAPDNVTVVVVDASDNEEAGAPSSPITVGSAAEPLAFDAPANRRVFRVPTVTLRHPIKAVTTEEAHFEPDSEEYLEQLIAEDQRRANRRRMRWLFVLAFALLLSGALLFFGYQWTQTRYFVGSQDGNVAIFQGVQQDVGPITLSHLHTDTGIPVDSLPPFYQLRLEDTISASTLAEAQAVVDRINDVRD